MPQYSLYCEDDSFLMCAQKRVGVKGGEHVMGSSKQPGRQPLCRLRYGGAADRWGFGMWLGSRETYEDSFLPSGRYIGTAEEALDCACGLYLGDPTAWLVS